MRLSTRSQSQRIDQLAQTEFHLSEEVLMESAGAAVAEEIHTFLKNKKSRILILSGSGNNGADGFVTARLLKRKGFSNLACAIIKEKPKPEKIWSFQLEKAQNSGVEILRLSEDRLKMEIGNAELIVEAILGTGFSGNLPDDLTDLVKFLNLKKKTLVAVDSPLGLDSDTGLPKPVAVRAQMTVTMGLCKPGFFISRGPRYAGQIKVHSIGFPTALLRREASTHFAWGEQASRAALPSRDPLSNKSDHGHVHVIAGSADYPGAGVLTANAAGRAGAGYVSFYGEPPEIYKNLQWIPEVILRDRKSLSLKNLDKNGCIVLGPGLGVTPETKNLIVDLMKRKFEKVILDADALTVVALEKLAPLPATWILTPHAGELAKLLGRTSKVLNADRFAATAEAAKTLGCVILFKGFRTIIADAHRQMVVLSGNSSLAKAGSGDVLSGFIASFYAQEKSAVRAACLGAYIHGKLADEWLKQGKDVLSLLPSDLSQAVPELIRKIRESDPHYLHSHKK